MRKIIVRHTTEIQNPNEITKNKRNVQWVVLSLLAISSKQATNQTTEPLQNHFLLCQSIRPRPFFQATLHAGILIRS